jgi:hypothetical protein
MCEYSVSDYAWPLYPAFAPQVWGCTTSAYPRSVRGASGGAGRGRPPPLSRRSTKPSAAPGTYPALCCSCGTTAELRKPRKSRLLTASCPSQEPEMQRRKGLLSHSCTFAFLVVSSPRFYHECAENHIARSGRKYVRRLIPLISSALVTCEPTPHLIMSTAGWRVYKA